jgi:hypothetical protein
VTLPRRPLARVAAPILVALAIALIVTAGMRAAVVSAQTFTPGTQAVVNSDGDALRLRSAPTVSATVIASIPHGSVVNIRDGSAQADGYTWQFVEWSGAFGWVAANYLVPLGANTATPSATPSMTVTPTATSSATPLPTPSVTPPSTSAATGTITGYIPPPGKPGLITWGGGSMESLIATAAGRGCNVRSVYAIRNGRFVGYSPGAPAFVNAGWVSQVGELTTISALVLSCAQPSQTAATTSTGGGATTSGTPSAPATAGGQPPGPGGNE